MLLHTIDALVSKCVYAYVIDSGNVCNVAKVYFICCSWTFMYYVLYPQVIAVHKKMLQTGITEIHSKSILCILKASNKHYS